jgi:hypothetical protein
MMLANKPTRKTREVNMQVTILEPTNKNNSKLTQLQFEEYFVKPNLDNSKMYNWNFGGFDENNCTSKLKCPIFKDYIDYKSFTIICDKNLESSISYWCEYFHGGGSISKIKKLPNNKIAIRSDYQCW